jgi:glutamine synthetase
LPGSDEVDTRLSSNTALAGEVRERLEAEGAKLLAMTMVDNGGITRVKCVPIKRLEKVATSGAGFSTLWSVSTVDDHFAAVSPFDSPSGDMRLIPDLSAARILTSAPGFAWAPVDQWTQELEPYAACQRSALKRVIERGKAAGMEFRCTFETELTLLTLDDEPIHRGPGYSPTALLPVEPFAVDLVDALEAAGIDVEQFHPEYGAGQVEFSVPPQDPMTAADQLVLSRTITRQVAHAHRMRASFAPVVLAGEAGNGCHFHMSASRDGVNLMQGGDGPGGLTADGASVLAGVLAALPSLLAVVAPSVASYARLQPGHWSGAYACWGVENREASLRFIPGTKSSRSQSANFEVKAVDGAANPYLVALVLLAAGLDGLERGATLSEPLQSDPGAATESELQALGIARLPATLAEATDLLAASTDAAAAMGSTLHDAFVGVRRLEWESLGKLDEQQLIDAHRWRY